ncbi:MULTISPECIES: acetate/propionate family kinase [Fischerella]|uniref:Acetate kinase n=1 Tax=Fischerella muscicola CCMEE 5323 TaxID=2019572 RepID=A0A2N6K1H8_FISMU|nr:MULTISPECIES: acetate kinase [Fischerella]MBD2430850.1 acetate kinase [Fischerella sp. FACHB-380]PLZ88470.1 acetate kinase [Fischerella muscicola CCMEE 5323]
MKILVLNSGSSSQKSCLYEIVGQQLPGHPPKPVWQASVDWTHHQGFAELEVKTAENAVCKEKIQADSYTSVTERVLQTLLEGETQVIKEAKEIDAVGHRVVHGGQEYNQATLVTKEVKAAIRRLASFAPIHNPANLEGIEATEKVFPEAAQVAVFDTGFHSQIPLSAAVYPGPYAWYEKEGIRRYGFHGISHQYCSQRTAQLLGKDLNSLRLITCHLGNGCSLTAIKDGKSIDTTMGFTPLDGLMMGTRCGSLDPGILIYLLRHQGIDADKLDDILNHDSGLKGISGISGDMRAIQTAIGEGNTRAQLAFDMYIHRLRSHIGSMLAVLGGLDAIVFTGGIGENHSLTRSAACEAFAFLGLKVDETKNQASPKDEDIAAVDSSIRVLVIQTQEDWAIAEECWHLLHKS